MRSHLDVLGRELKQMKQQKQQRAFAVKTAKVAIEPWNPSSVEAVKRPEEDGIVAATKTTMKPEIKQRSKGMQIPANFI
jgi:hypothetical protein